MPYRASELRPPLAPRRFRWGVAAVCVASAVAAGGFWRRGRVARRAPVVVVAPSSAPAIASGCASAQVVGIEAGSQHVLCGATRATVSPRREVVAAREQFGDLIVSVNRVRRGWVFVTHNGTVAQSDTFVGELRSLGRVPCYADLRNQLSFGRAAVIDVAGRLWTTAGDAPVAEVTLPGRVISAAFADVATGAVVLERGELLVTGDGGASWRSVDLDRDVARWVSLNRRGLVVGTTRGIGVLTHGELRPWDICEGDYALQDNPLLPIDGLSSEVPHDLVNAAVGRTRGVFRVSSIAGRCEGRHSLSGGPSNEPAFLPSADEWPYRCHLSGDRRSEPWRTLERRFSPRSRPVETYLSDAVGVAAAQRWQGPARTPLLIVAWSGADHAGRFVGVAGPQTTDLTRVNRPDDWPDSGVSRINVHAITRRGVLVSDATLRGPLLWGVAGGAFVSMHQPPAECHMGTHYRRIVAAMPDASVVIVQMGSVDDYRFAASATEIGPEGAVRRHLGMLAENHRFAIGRWGDEVGLVRWSAHPAVQSWFHPLDSAPARPLPRVGIGTPRACQSAERPSGPNAITLWFDSLPTELLPVTSEDQQLDSSTFAQVTGAEVEWTREGTCVRSVMVNRDGQGRDHRVSAPMTLRARPGDRFEGSLYDAGIVRASCRVDRTPRPASDD